jgi:hypothetical protein
MHAVRAAAASHVVPGRGCGGVRAAAASHRGAASRFILVVPSALPLAEQRTHGQSAAGAATRWRGVVEGDQVRERGSVAVPVIDVPRSHSACALRIVLAAPALIVSVARVRLSVNLEAKEVSHISCGGSALALEGCCCCCCCCVGFAASARGLAA